MSPMKLILAVVLAAAFVSPAWSQGVTALNLDEVRIQQQQIRTDLMASKGRYADMPSAKRDQIIAKQDSLFRLMEGKQAEEELSDDQHMEMINTLQWIQAAVNDAEDERVICKNVKTTGSQMPKRVCKTVAQIRVERENARKNLDRGALCTKGQPCASRE